MVHDQAYASAHRQQLVHFADVSQRQGLLGHVLEDELALLALGPTGPLHQQGEAGAVGAFDTGHVHFDALVLGEHVPALVQGLGHGAEAQHAAEPEPAVTRVLETQRSHAQPFVPLLVTALGALVVLRRWISSSRPLAWTSGPNWPR